MDKETLKEIIKNEIELLKIYSAFIIGLVPGIVHFFIKYLSNYDKLSLYLLLGGLLFLIIVAIAFINSFIKIIKLTKTLKKC